MHHQCQPRSYPTHTRPPSCAAAATCPCTAPPPPPQVRNVDTGNKTGTLAEAAMRGELDETDSAFGNEAAAAAVDSGKASSEEEDGGKAQQFVTAAH